MALLDLYISDMCLLYLFGLGRVTDERGVVCDSAYYQPLSIRVKLLRGAYRIEPN